MNFQLSCVDNIKRWLYKAPGSMQSLLSDDHSWPTIFLKVFRKISAKRFHFTLLMDYIDMLIGSSCRHANEVVF